MLECTVHQNSTSCHVRNHFPAVWKRLAGWGAVVGSYSVLPFPPPEPLSFQCWLFRGWRSERGMVRTQEIPLGAGNLGRWPCILGARHGCKADFGFCGCVMKPQRVPAGWPLCISPGGLGHCPPWFLVASGNAFLCSQEQSSPPAFCSPRPHQLPLPRPHLVQGKHLHGCGPGTICVGSPGGR